MEAKFKRVLATSLLLASLLAARSEAQESIGTTGAWDGFTSAPTLSRDFFASAIGQSFTAPNYDARLTSFSFFLGYSPFFPPADLNVQFYAYVMGWNGSTVTDLVYRSDVQSGSPAFPGVERRDFAPAVMLSPNTQYLAFLSTHEADPFDIFDPFAVPAYQNVGVVTTDAYSGGSVVQSQATDFATLTAGAWLVDPGADLAFEATVDPVSVPEPGSLILLLTGGAGLLLVRRRAEPHQDRSS